MKNLPHLRYSAGHAMSPQVPDLISTRGSAGGVGGHPPIHPNHLSNHHNHHPNHVDGGGGGSLSAEHIHNPYGSIGLDRTFPPPPSPLSMPKSPSRGQCDELHWTLLDIFPGLSSLPRYSALTGNSGCSERFVCKADSVFRTLLLDLKNLSLCRF